MLAVQKLDSHSTISKDKTHKRPSNQLVSTASRMTMPKSVFITGAKLGIGLEFVRQYAISDNPPKHIFASARNPTEAHELIALADKYKNVHLVVLDVANDEQIEAAVKLVTALVGDDGLNLLINNAAIFEIANFPHISREVINRHFNVNASSPLILIQAFLPLLRKAATKQSTAEMSISKAAVISLTSASASLNCDESYDASSFGAFPYDSSKLALGLLSKLIALDLKNENILVAAISPGYVDTPSAKRMAEVLRDGERLFEIWGRGLTPKESITMLLATMRRLTSKHTGGFFGPDGEKIEG